MLYYIIESCNYTFHAHGSMHNTSCIVYIAHNVNTHKNTMYTIAPCTQSIMYTLQVEYIDETKHEYLLKTLKHIYYTEHIFFV